MSTLGRMAIFVLAAGIGAGLGMAQAPQGPQPPAAVSSAAGPVDLEWVPPALAPLSTLASTKSSFTLDRSMLSAAAGMTSDAETRQAIDKIDGVSVHLLRFGAAGIADEAQVEAIRKAYHLRGWKHLVTNSSADGSQSPVHSGTTDVWLVLDGVNVRGAVVLAETPRSLTLVTMAGNLSPVDLLHLRGHFGIPRFDGDDFKDAKDK